MKTVAIMLCLPMLFTIGCSDDAIFYRTAPEDTTPPITYTVPKWYNDHAAAISLTMDTGWGTGGSMPQLAIDQEAVLSRGLVVDYEVVTATYEPYPTSQADLRNEMTLGVHFFGHGHHHVPHDQLTFQESLESFSTCFNLLRDWDLNPRAYAYPNGSGREASTQQALALSGFICGRNYEPKTENKFICADDVTEPENWYFLPSIPIASVYDPTKYVNTHEELLPFITTAIEKTAWIIPCYHWVGFPGLWGYYPLEEFEKDLDAIVAEDFWCSNMDVVACYIKERNALTVTFGETRTVNKQTVVDVVFDDGLPDNVYDVPVTVDLSIHAGYMECDPPMQSGDKYIAQNGVVRVNVVPDGTRYQLTLWKRARRL